MPDSEEIAQYLDAYLNTPAVEDYSGAVNGLQFMSEAPITRIAAAVDFSLRTLDACVEAKANFLIVHHGMFWGGSVSFVGTTYRRVKLLVEKQVAVYSSHLPLDMHPDAGNNVLLARELGLEPSRGFAHSKGVAIGVAGECEITTAELVKRAELFSGKYGGRVVASGNQDNRVTNRWGICTGSGASAETLKEALESGIDTLIVGEGPHWTAVAAEDAGIAVIYAGHYATETSGVQAIARKVSNEFHIPWSFIHAPTGL